MKSTENQSVTLIAETASVASQDSAQLMQDLLAKDAGQSEQFEQAEAPIHGIVIAQLAGISANGRALLHIAALGRDAEARIACAPQSLQDAKEVAVMFEQGDVAHPIVIGPMYDAPSQSRAVEVNNQRIVIEAEHELELRCGEAVIVLTADGRILQRGAYISSHASATQRIRGGSVQIN